MSLVFYRGLAFENSGAEDQVLEKEYLFSMDAVITRLSVSTLPSLFLSAAHGIELRLNSEALLSQGGFAPFLLYAGSYVPRVHVPVKAGQKLHARWRVPPGRSYFTLAYREGLTGEDLAKESFFYVTTKDRRDGVTLLQPNIQKDYRWEGLFVYDDEAALFGPNLIPQVGFPELFLGSTVFPRLGPPTSPSLIDDVVQVRDFPSEFVLDYLPVSSIGGRVPPHWLRDPIPVASQTVLNIAVASKTRTGGRVTAMVLGTHVQENIARG